MPEWADWANAQCGLKEYPSYPEEAFKVSIEGAYFKPQMTKCARSAASARCPSTRAVPSIPFWDIGKSDNTAIWFHQNKGEMHHLVDYYENNGEDVEHYARILREKAAERGWTYDKHYGPHDLDNSHWLLPGSERVQDVARNLGIHFFVVPRIHNKQDAIEAARNFLSMAWIDEEHCAQGIRCLDSFCKEWDEKAWHVQITARAQLGLSWKRCPTNRSLRLRSRLHPTAE